MNRSRGQLAAGLRRSAGLLYRSVLGFLYPPGCPLCGCEDELAADALGSEPSLCTDCRERIPVVERFCGRCGAPTGPFEGTMGRCHHCRKDRFRFASVVSLGVYAGHLGSACGQIKKPHTEPLAAALAGLLWERGRDELARFGAELVVPIPGHWTRRMFRDDAPATLARVWGRCLNLRVHEHILAKVRLTPAQAKLPSTRRRTNLRGAFRVRRRAPLSGRTVLLVDDVLTTGTTANEAARALIRAGAKNVCVAVLARGLGRKWEQA